MRKFDQHKIRETVASLRVLATTPNKKVSGVCGRAADLIEDMAVVVYGITEKLPGMEDVETGEKP